jgi:uncharacterized protein
MFFFDPMWFIIMLPALIFMMVAQAKVNSAFNKYSKIPNGRGISGVEVARSLLRDQGLFDVTVEPAQGRLTDHYDPSKKVLRLSPDVYNRASVASLGIVAHEVGHAVQDKVGYSFMKFRTAFVPAANLGSSFGYILVLVGAFLMMMGTKFGLSVIWAGVLLFSLAVVFSLITLPVEYDASNRARKMLNSSGLVSQQEANGASAVLSAAALTYVAATLQAMSQLLYFVLMALGMGRRN